MINGIIVRKLEMLDVVLAELRSLGTVTADQLSKDWKTYRAVERDLQVLAEIVIDVSHRLIALAGLTPATSGADAIDRCVQLGALKSSVPYQDMIRFRNLVVHLYERVELPILVNIVNQHLGDFEQFRDEIVDYVQRASDEDDQPTAE